MQRKQSAAKEEQWISHCDTNTRRWWAALGSSVYSLMWTHVQRDNSNFCLVKFSHFSWLSLNHWFSHLTFCCRLIPPRSIFLYYCYFYGDRLWLQYRNACYNFRRSLYNWMLSYEQKGKVNRMETNERRWVGERM